VISVASNTKMMTSLLLHRLAYLGALNLSDPVTKYFNEDRKPAFTTPNPYDQEAGPSGVTLESIGGQVSGLTHDISCPVGPECTEEVIINLTSSLPLFRKPFTHPSYSNLGYSLLGHCCERAGRDFFQNDSLTYEDLMKKELFDNLEMDSTGFNYPDDIKARMAIGYAIASDSSLVVDQTFAKPLDWYNPTGGCYSTMKDMLNYAKHLLAQDAVLSPSAFEGFFLPGVGLSDGVSSYGRAGWEVFYANGFRTITKSGLVGGFNTEIVMIPELKLGIFGWVNLLSELAIRFSTDITNLIVPALLEYIEENQPKLEVPDVMDQIVGEYSVEGEPLLSIESNEQTASTGVYIGSVMGQPVWYVYDKKTTESYQKPETYFFRFFSMPADGMDSCMVMTMSGFDDGLAMFQYTGETWTATYLDALTAGTKNS